MKKLIILIILVTSVGSLHVVAQQNVHEFSISGGAGLSTLIYQLSSGDRNGGFGGNFGLGYTYCRSNERVTSTGRIFRENWGFYTGIELGAYHAKAKIRAQESMITPNLTDYEDDSFEFHTSFPKYIEKQSAMLLTIPLMAQFQYKQYYVMGGFKFAIPVKARYSAKNATLTNEAYYEEYKNWIKNLEFVGCDYFEGKDFNGKLDFGPSLMLALESGMRWRLNDNLSLFTGVYLDYGLSNSFKGSQKGFIKYDPDKPADFSINSVLSLNAEQVKMMAVGLKLRLTLEK